jgi:calmodulin
MSTPDTTAQADDTDDGDSAFGAFSLFDQDGDGLVSAEDISATIRGLGLEITDQDAAAFVADADANGDGMISEAEFDAVRSQEQVPDGVTPAEDAFDKDGSGYISLAELETFAEYMGCDATEIMTDADTDGDGQLSLAEFTALITQS